MKLLGKRKELVHVNLELGVKNAGLADVLPVEVDGSVHHCLCLLFDVHAFQVWPEAPAVRELATKISKQKRAMDCKDYKPYIAVDLKK